MDADRVGLISLIKRCSCVSSCWGGVKKRTKDVGGTTALLRQSTGIDCRHEAVVHHVSLSKVRAFLSVGWEVPVQRNPWFSLFLFPLTFITFLNSDIELMMWQRKTSQLRDWIKSKPTLRKKIILIFLDAGALLRRCISSRLFRLIQISRILKTYAYVYA